MNKKPIPYKLRLIYFFAFIFVFLVGFPILVFYSAGYSLDETFGLSVRGGIYIFAPEPNTSIFVGNELKGVSGFFRREILIDRLKPDQYLVLAANESYWPWAKFVQVERGEVEPLFPLMVPKVVSFEEIIKTDSDYKNIVALFARPVESLVATTTTANSVATSTVSVLPPTITTRNVRLWVTNDVIYGQWQANQDIAPKYFCAVTPATIRETAENGLRSTEKNCTSPMLIFRSVTPVRTFDFYPSREDAIILALDNGIYAVEVDHRAYQNFYPLYKGAMPDFRVDGDDIYVKDQGRFYILDVEI